MRRCKNWAIFCRAGRERSVHPVLWVGAGASAAAGYPTLGQLEQPARAAAPGGGAVGFARSTPLLRGIARPISSWSCSATSRSPALCAVARGAGTPGRSRCLSAPVDHQGRSAHRETRSALLASPLCPRPSKRTSRCRPSIPCKSSSCTDVGDWEHVVLTAASYAEFQRAYPLLQQQLNLHLRTARLSSSAARCVTRACLTGSRGCQWRNGGACLPAGCSSRRTTGTRCHPTRGPCSIGQCQGYHCAAARQRDAPVDPGGRAPRAADSPGTGFDLTPGEMDWTGRASDGQPAAYRAQSTG